VRPFGVDVSSGVEATPGVKSPAAIAAFVQGARGAARALREEHR
jgi:phosphoribosylanthranilate isomerase